MENMLIREARALYVQSNQKPFSFVGYDETKFTIMGAFGNVHFAKDVTMHARFEDFCFQCMEAVTYATIFS